MGRIDREGRKHRVDALRKKIREVFLLALWHVGIGVKAEALLFELWLKLVAPARVLIVDHPPHALADRGKRIASRQTVRPCFKRVHLLLLLETRDAHFEKFVQIGADDAKKFQAFEKRIRFLNRLIENALVEFQPAQLAVDEVGTFLKIHPRIVRLRPARSRGDFRDSATPSNGATELVPARRWCRISRQPVREFAQACRVRGKRAHLVRHHLEKPNAAKSCGGRRF